MNVLLFTLEYPPFYGGVANYYEALVKYCPARHNIFVINNNKKKLLSNKLPFLKWLPAILILYREIKKRKIDYIIVGHLLPLGVVVYLLSIFFKFKYAVVLHGTDFSFAVRESRKKIISIMILKKASNIICANSYTASLVKDFLNNKNKVSVVNPGINRQFRNIDESLVVSIKNKYNLRNKYVLLSVGRLVRRKGFDNVIKAVSKILKQIPDLVYVIIGSGEDRSYLENLIKTHEARKNVIILDAVNDDKKWAWYNICDCFIMTSRNIDGDYEGFGIVYLEAGLFGKPIVAGDSGGVRDIIQDRFNGILVNSEDVSNISSAILRLYKEEGLRSELGEQAMINVQSDFFWERRVEDFYSAIER